MTDEMGTSKAVRIDGPFFDDLRVGDRFSDAPAMTLTAGHAALHQAILGDRLPLSLDWELSRRVTGQAEPVVHPALAWDAAIGQSSEVTRNVVANLFYRGLVFKRFPHQGDTLKTQTEVVGLRQNRARAGRQPTGLATLRIRTVDQLQRPVLDFLRCAMLRLRGNAGADESSGVLDVGEEILRADGRSALAGWDLSALRPPSRGLRYVNLQPGYCVEADGGDVVSAAPELARLTLNIARVHHDGGDGRGERLVYGGHTVGLALTQATRMLPGIVTVTAWQRCDHLAPVREGMRLRSRLTVLDRSDLAHDRGLVWMQSEVHSEAEDGETPVLDWRFAALVV